MRSKWFGVAVVAEVREGKFHRSTWELLGKAYELNSKLGECVYCFVVGKVSDPKEPIYYGANKVVYVEDPELSPMRPREYVEVLKELVLKYRPSIVLGPATLYGRHIMPRLAAKLRTGITADCTDLDIDEEGNLVQIRPASTGLVMAKIVTPKHRPQMATVRPGIMKPLPRDESRGGEVIREEVKVRYYGDVEVIEKVRYETKVSLAEAGIIVSAGRGFRKPEDLWMAKKLAELLGGVMGVSRPLVDAGWVSRDYQVGFSGTAVSPRLYIAIGISGSVQHVTGIRGAKTVIAVNKDPNAPIFNVAQYGFVADLYDLIPKVIDILSKLRRTKAAHQNP